MTLTRTPRKIILQFRVNERELELLNQAATEVSLQTSSWVRSLAITAAKEVTK